MPKLLVLSSISSVVLLQTVSFMFNMKEGSGLDESANSSQTHSHLNFPFLKDPQTVQYISTQIQVLFVLCGPPGKGPSPLAQAIASTYRNSVICCSESTGQSDSSVSVEGDHQTCQGQIEDSCKKHIQVIVADLNKSSPEDLQDYFSLAHQYNYTTLVIEPNSTLSYNREYGASFRKEQDIAKDDDKKPDLTKMIYPFFYGWFLGYNISLNTQRIGRKIFGECIQQPKFVEIFKKYALPNSPRTASGDLDFDRYFSLDGFITGPTMLHCTSFFSNYSETPGSEQYATSPAVQKGTGRAYNLTLIGFLITPRTFGARIKLNSEELLLWAHNASVVSDLSNFDGASSVDKAMHQHEPIKLDQKPSSGSEVKCASHDQLCLSMSGDKVNQEQVALDQEGDEETACPSGWHPTRFSPTCGPGSRAHLTLGTGTGIEAVQTGYDLNLIVQKELEAVEKGEVILTLPLESGTIRCYGDGNWAVYLEKPLEICTLFTGWY